MKHFGIILLLGGTLTAADFHWTQSFNGLSIQIPDNEISGAVDSRVVSLPFEVRKLTVHLSMTGSSAFNGDLYAHLSHVDHLAVLLNRPGRTASNASGYGDPGINIQLDDEAENGDVHFYRRRLFGNDQTPLSTALTGTWAPDGRTANPLTVSESDPRIALLEGFKGMSAAGTWTLFAADLEQTGTAGLTGWTLGFTLDPTSLIFEIPQPTPTTITLLHQSATQARVIQFPSRGTLFQTSDGINPGNEINESNPDVSDTQGRVIYHPEETFAGVDSFQFEAQGGLNPSPALTSVQIRVRSSQAFLVGQHLFYNNSNFDGNDPAGNALDDHAIAPSHSALRHGQSAQLNHISNYSLGLNGIMIDIMNLAGSVSQEDFQFKYGNNNTPNTWAIAPDPVSVQVRVGQGLNGSDRITLIWADNNRDGIEDPNEAIFGKWLEVTVLHNSRTGLSASEVFYFGSTIGETGNDPLSARVTTADVLLIRNNPRTLLNPAPIDSPYDMNRDGKVNAQDRLLARIHKTTFIDELRLIQLNP